MKPLHHRAAPIRRPTVVKLRLLLILLALSAPSVLPAAVVRAWSMMHRWPQQTVHYYIDSAETNWTATLTEQPKSWTYDSTPELWGVSIEQTIADGLAMLRAANPGLRFVRLDKPDAKRFPHAVRFRKRPEILVTGMATANGFYNGRSRRYEIHINKWNHAGIVAHEMLHILGVSHAQSAANRQTYAIVYTGQTLLKGTPNEFTVPNNVRVGRGNFNLLTGRRLLGGYDFESIMHYSDSIMKKRGPKDPPTLPKVTIGRRINPGPLTGVRDSLPKSGIHYWEEEGNGRSYHAQRSRLSPIDSWALREMYFHTTNPETGTDFNGDGFADLISGTEVIYGAVYNSKTPGLNRRNLPRARQRLGDGAVICGDFNGDYRMDVALDTGKAIQVIYAARDNDGRDGKLGLAKQGARLETPISRRGDWAVGDFNGDGYSDLAVRGQLTFGSSSGLKESRALEVEGSALAAGDYDGDGYTDLAAVVPNAFLRIFPGSETGLKQVSEEFQGTWTGLLAVGDFDCNGRQELAIAVRDGIAVLDGGKLRKIKGLTAAALLAADLNGDGYSDLALGDPSANRVRILNGSPTGLTRSVAETIRPRHAGVEAEAGLQFGRSFDRGDFDGNGYVDLVIGTASNPIVRYHGSPFDNPQTVIGRSFPHYEELDH